MKKSKFLKTLGFSCMAIFMGSLTILGGCATNLPTNNGNDLETTTTSGLGLDPKNDPVVYTTQSGLEIKMSNATNKYSGTTTLTSNTNYSYTQDLTSFYYFTMGTYSGTIYTATSVSATYSVSNEPVNWIILGLGNNTGYFLDSVSANLFSTWKTNTSGLSHNNTNGIAYGPYFFEEIFESTTPAGSAISSELATKAYIMEKVKASIPVNPGNLNEIPEGCMLVLSEKLLGQMYFNSSGAVNYTLYNSESNCYNTAGNGNYGNRYRYKGNSNTDLTQTWTISGNAGGSLYNYINNLFSKNTAGTILKNSLGFTQAQSDLIVPQQLYTNYYNYSSYVRETPSTDGGTYYTMFPLAYKGANSSVTQSFCYETYLTSQATRIAALIGSNQYFSWSLRSGINAGETRRSDLYCRVSSDSYSSSIQLHYGATRHVYGVRPAMVMQLN